MSEHFCGSCNRLRLTADGNLKVIFPVVLVHGDKVIFLLLLVMEMNSEHARYLQERARLKDGKSL